MTDQELNQALDKIQARFDAVNQFYLKKIAKQIKTIGELNQSSVNMLVIMAEMTSDIEEITQELTRAIGITKPEIEAIYAKAMQDTFTDPRFTKAFKAGLKVPPAQRQQLVRYTQLIAAQTENTLDNLSNTTGFISPGQKGTPFISRTPAPVPAQTAISNPTGNTVSLGLGIAPPALYKVSIADPYKQAVDKAVYAVSSGLTSYSSAIRDSIRQIGYSGMQVYYPSGYHRRLDTAIRQNIIDATKQIAQHGANTIGQALGYNAKELSAHMNSAPDHEPVQGHVLLNEEFDKMQAGLPFSDVNGIKFGGFRRPIGEWNCRHFAFPFSTEYSKPVYTPDQLQQWIDANHEGCVIDGKQRTKYECTQMMRKLETEVRRWKDVAVMAQIAGDDTLRRECQMNINKLVAKYGQIEAISGLKGHRDRMTVQGFKAVKIKPAAK